MYISLAVCLVRIGGCLVASVLIGSDARMIWAFQGIILTTRDTAHRKESKRFYSPLHKLHVGVEVARIAYK